MATLGVTGLGAGAGLAVAIPVATENNCIGSIEKLADIIIGGPTIGATMAFAPAYGGTYIGYHLGKLVGYVSSRFV